MADDASAKAYALEQRVNGLVAAYLPLTGGNVTGFIGGGGGVLQIGDVLNGPTAPGSGVAESWHDLRPLVNSFVGSITNEFPPQYRMAPDGWVELFGAVQTPAAGSYNGITWQTLPAGYRPAKFTSLPVAQSDGTMATDTTAGNPRLYTDATGVLQFFGISPSLNSKVIRFSVRFPSGNTPGLITT